MRHGVNAQHVQEFGSNYAERLRHVAKTGEPIEITYYRRDYVTVVPTDWYREALEALEEKRAREGERQEVAA